MEAEKQGEQKSSWMSKICSAEGPLKTLASEKFHGATVSFDEGNDTLIIVNSSCELSRLAGVLTDL